MASKNHRGVGGMFSKCGRYGYSYNGSGRWLDIEKIGVKSPLTHDEQIFKNLVAVFKEKTKFEATKLLEKFISNHILPDDLLMKAIDCLPKR